MVRKAMVAPMTIADRNKKPVRRVEPEREGKSKIKKKEESIVIHDRKEKDEAGKMDGTKVKI